MYRGFKLHLPEPSSLLQAKNVITERRFTEQTTYTKEVLSQFLTNEHVLDGSEIQKYWFPQIKADVFISHSHNDEAIALRLASWLEENFGLIAFIDSQVWRHANDLKKQLADTYCVITNSPSKLYEYEAFSHASTHVDIMLSTALAQMMNRTEALFFLNSENSITSYKDSDKTSSAWIYSEIATSKIIEKQKPIRWVNESYQRKYFTFSVESKRLEITHNLDLSHLATIDVSDLEKWKNKTDRTNKAINALDLLYEEVPAPKKQKEMDTKYQLIILGHSHRLESRILATFFRRLNELGISKHRISIHRRDNIDALYSGNAPAYCLYFGSNTNQHSDSNILKRLIEDATLILPIVEDLAHFKKYVPEILHPINGFELTSEREVESIASLMLEGFSLLRISRRLFISYCRKESSRVAMQLYEIFERKGFDVFLDTHSIKQGEHFQDELWHRMADTDVVIALNTPSFLKTKWTAQEFAKANALSIGILQLIWPSNTSEKTADLSISKQLTDSDFQPENAQGDPSDQKLCESSLETLVEAVESLRARSLASRQDKIISEFICAAHNNHLKAYLQYDRIIFFENSSNETFIIIPTVGVPQSLNYNKSEELIAHFKEQKVSKIFILYDHINIRDKWITHLDWLDNYLPVGSIKIKNIETWINQQ